MPGRPKSNVRHRRPIVIVLIVAFALRFAWLVYARPEPVSDFLAYHRLAENLLDKGFLGFAEPTAQFLPGHPSLLAALMLASRSVFWLSFLMVILSTATCGLVYLLARRLTGRESVALVAAGAAAVSPTFVLYSPVLGTEHLFGVLMLGALLVTLRLHSENTFAALGAGALTGFAALTRGEAIFYVPVVLAVVWFADPSRTRRAKLRIAALTTTALIVVVAPWMVRNAVVVEPGVYLSTVGGMNFYYGHNPNYYGWSADVPWSPGDDLEANRLGWEIGLAYIRDKPSAILQSIRDGTYNLFASPHYALFWATQQQVPGTEEFLPRAVRFENELGKILPAAAAFYLAMAGAALLIWRHWPRSLRIVVPGLILFSWTGHAVLLFGHPRFRYFLDIVLTALVALTVVTLWEVGRKRGDGEIDPHHRLTRSPAGERYR